MSIGAIAKSVASTPVSVGRRIEQQSPMLRKVTGPVNRVLPSIPVIGTVGSLFVGAAVIFALSMAMSRVLGVFL